MKFTNPTPHFRWLVSPHTSTKLPTLQQWWISGLTLPDNYQNALNWAGEWRDVPTAIAVAEEPQKSQYVDTINQLGQSKESP